MPKKKPEKDTDQKTDGKKSDSSPAFFDVSKPGSTPASPTSRPIIVGHQTALGQDPLLAKTQPDGSQSGSSTELKLTKQKKISPISTPEEGSKDAVNEELKDQKNQEETRENSSSPNSNAAIDALAGEVDAKAQAKEQSKADKEQDEKTQALIESSKYHLPITEGGRKAASERIVSWLLIFLLVAAAGAWLAVDAGYLDIGIDLPYDLIKE
jgi:glucan-binding YG repeat protein